MSANAKPAMLVLKSPFLGSPFFSPNLVLADPPTKGGSSQISCKTVLTRGGGAGGSLVVACSTRRASVHNHMNMSLRWTVDAGRGIGRRECDDSERDRRGRRDHEGA